MHTSSITFAKLYVYVCTLHCCIFAYNSSFHICLLHILLTHNMLTVASLIYVSVFVVCQRGIMSIQ